MRSRYDRLMDKTNYLEGAQKPPEIQKGKFKEIRSDYKKYLKMLITDRNSGSNIDTPVSTNLMPKIGLQLFINTNESLISVALVIIS